MVGIGGAELCGFGIGILIVLVFGSLILRASVWLANKCLTQPGGRYDDDYDDEPDDDWDAYDRPRPRRRRPESAVPEPTFGWGMVVVLVSTVANFAVNLMMGVAARGAGGQGAVLGVQLLSIVVNYFVSAGVFGGMLPTSFPRACLVALFWTLIWIALVVVVVVGVLAAVGGGRFGL